MDAARAVMEIDGDGAAGPRAPRRRRWCAVRLSRARRGATSAERVGFAVRGRAAAHRRRAITVAAVHVLRTSSGGARPRHMRIPCALALCAHDVPCLYTRSARLRTPCCALGVPVCVCALCCWGLRDPLACARALCGTCAVRLCAVCSCCVCLCCALSRDAGAWSWRVWCETSVQESETSVQGVKPRCKKGRVGC